MNTAVFETEVLLLMEELYDYRDCVVDNMLALDDGFFFIPIGKCGQLYYERVESMELKQGNKEQAFQTFRLLQY